ncbi:hypothetical protein IGI04_015632 [Brassica rapa subsp. trilocularis]|uniref:Uncharacterized protein n=1 Tax=Brassica rapa subsp. trilocularis TaxID=1813537 RepID=A0ABQ7MQM6_BRACM|nr:hypothetical protein IGI04_015632 [Brassica rapa subsp. trilocularis]
MKIFRGNSDGHLNIRRNFLGIFLLIRGKRISCACISINLYCSSEFPRNIPRKFRGTHVWGFKTSNFFALVIQTAKRCFRFKNPTSSEKPRNIPKKFRGKTSVPRNFLGIFRGFSKETETLKAKP